MSKLPISVGILAWNSGKTLRNTLESYRKNGLFNVVSEVFIFFQEVSEEDIEISLEYRVCSVGIGKNIGIGRAFLYLCEMAEEEVVLLLEHDWELVEDEATSYIRLKSALQLLSTGGLDAVRMRHRFNYGFPLYSIPAYKGRELEHYCEVTGVTSPHLFDCIHWIEHPDKQFPDQIKKIGDWYVTTSRWSGWTNNPCLYKKDFYIDMVSKRVNDSDKLLEPTMSRWWSTQNFKIAYGYGLFKHNDLLKQYRT